MADPIDHLATVRAALDLAGKAPAGSCPYCASRISMVERDGFFRARCSHRGCGATGPKMRSITRAADLFCCPPQRTAGGSAIAARPSTGRGRPPAAVSAEIRSRAIAALADECERLRAENARQREHIRAGGDAVRSANASTMEIGTRLDAAGERIATLETALRAILAAPLGPEFPAACNAARRMLGEG